MSDVVKFFFEPEDPEESAKVKHITQCDWEQAPHLNAAAKAQLLASTPPYQRDARTKGIPQLGAGPSIPWPSPRSSCSTSTDPGSLGAQLRHGRRLEPHRGGVGARSTAKTALRTSTTSIPVHRLST
jgi:hypothetical protein